MATGFVQRIKGKIKAHVLYLGTGGIVLNGASGSSPGNWPNAGTPTNGLSGTYAGSALPGDYLTDTTNFDLYQNVGSQASPTWSKFMSASDGVVYPTQDTLTAHAGGGQASATVLNYGLNRLSVCATANDSAQLPAATVGAMCWLANDGAAAAKVFGKNGNTDTIDGVAGATGVALTNAKRAFFHCLTAGAWVSQQGGVST